MQRGAWKLAQMRLEKVLYTYLLKPLSWVGEKQRPGYNRQASLNPLSLSCDWCLGLAPWTQLLKKSIWVVHQIGGKPSPAARDSKKVARTLNPHCYPHTENGG